VHKKYRTPMRTIVVFSGVAIVQTLFAFFTPGKAGSNAAIDLLTNLYAFGATTGYLLVFAALMVLRFRDPYTPRPYKMPFNVPIRVGTRVVEFPILGIVGMLGVSTILFEVILTHDVGRIAGPGWIIVAVLLYMLHRRRQRMPLVGNIPRDWEATQKRVLLEAEEYESLEEYEQALADRDAAK
jgi:APA family basic amino acid/polyamine antiporter